MLGNRQRASRIRNRSAPYSNRSAFNYNPNIDYAKQSVVTIELMNKTCPKSFVKKKWSDEPNGMCYDAATTTSRKSLDRWSSVFYAFFKEYWNYTQIIQMTSKKPSKEILLIL